MHSSARRHQRTFGEVSANETHETPETMETKGLILQGGRRYDLHGWLLDTFMFRGQGRELRRKAISLARLQPGEQVLDVGCGTGTLALAVARRVTTTGRVVGIDPSAEQIARARAKAARRHIPTTPVDFQIGVIEQLPFPDRTFNVVFSTLMMHHLPAPLKRQGLVEIARVLKPGGRVVIADFTRKQDRQGRAARFHAGGSSLQELATLVEDVGFSQVDAENMQPARFSAFPGAGIIVAHQREIECPPNEQTLPPDDI
jgi:ubiquinone/menaquinone biosynthesis C-methylase UbiE